LNKKIFSTNPPPIFNTKTQTSFLAFHIAEKFFRHLKSFEAMMKKRSPFWLDIYDYGLKAQDLGSLFSVCGLINIS